MKGGARAWLGVCALTLAAGVNRASLADTFLTASGSDLIGAVGTVRSAYEDTLTDIARRTGLGYEEIIRANPGVDPWLPGHDTPVVLPTQYLLPAGPRRGIIVNIAEYRIYYFYETEGRPAVATFPISIGRIDWATPLGRHSIIGKTRNPTWYPPESIRDEHAADGRPLATQVPPGPDNPLGEYAMRLNFKGYLIHGTNRPVGIGMRVTHGCVRMYPEDVEWLYQRVSVGTPVQIVNQPIKFGWEGDALYLQVHPPLDEAEGDDAVMTALTADFVRATAGRSAEVDWSLIGEVYRRKDGIPVRVGTLVTAEAAAPGGARKSTTTRATDKYPKSKRR
jgi:L,D-transpeptidase ErfK/SrfK